MSAQPEQARAQALVAHLTGGGSPRAASSGINIALSTHVLNTSNGLPAADMHVTLEALEAPAAGTSGSGEVWRSLGSARTNADGRISSFPPLVVAASTPSARFRLVFESEAYFRAMNITPAFFPQIAIQWQVSHEHDAQRAKLHVPLLLSPYGYSTYRGS